MNTVYLLAGLICIHLVWAFLNTIGIRNAFFSKQSTAYLFFLLNWLIPILGPLVTHVSIRSSFSRKHAGSPVNDQSGSSHLFTGNEGQNGD